MLSQPGGAEAAPDKPGRQGPGQGVGAVPHNLVPGGSTLRRKCRTGCRRLPFHKKEALAYQTFWTGGSPSFLVIKEPVWKAAPPRQRQEWGIPENKHSASDLGSMDHSGLQSRQIPPSAAGGTDTTARKDAHEQVNSGGFSPASPGAQRGLGLPEGGSRVLRRVGP